MGFTLFDPSQFCSRNRVASRVSAIHRARVPFVHIRLSPIVFIEADRVTYSVLLRQSRSMPALLDSASGLRSRLRSPFDSG